MSNNCPNTYYSCHYSRANSNVTITETPAVNESKSKLLSTFPVELILAMMAVSLVILMVLSIYGEFVKPMPADTEENMPHQEMQTELIKFGIIPDVINTVPKYLLEVLYGHHYIVYFGNKINPEYLAPPPHTVTWPSDENGYYTLIMIDPDYPSRMKPTEREYLHWLVVNIRDDNRLSGDDIAEYYAPEPQPGSGPHRYIFLIFRQPKGKMEFDEPWSDVYHDKYRKKFSTRKFAKKYGFGDPEAVNFFIGEIFANGTTTPHTQTAC